jgi:hypothetical protein
MNPRQNPKAYARALQAIAQHRCVTDLTDGFCGPSDGECRHMAPHRKCSDQARGILQALAYVGMTVVWDFDPELWGAR